ncbi:DNA-binding protein [Solihabitans fulvus]|uniref:DNA-binding protein n=1 Tax=Solihabitans fulvus TaxID=1892852 RepID=A0A5B2WYJ6_9PSEU|nr:carboxymuconolactone decarboxylase family protein [Solihabitans fulvus]KAA2255994.1 DNA-binding protein [Solihabitans fulvus]
MSIRYIAAVPRRRATGRVAEVYAQSSADFGQPAFQMLSPAPEVHAAAWALLRESELVGRAPRVAKEAVAVAVSAANGCRFCLDAHAILVHATGEHELAEDLLHGRTPADPALAGLVAWAKATDPPGALPFPVDLAPEYLGTVLSTHFTNRMFSTLTTETLLPGNLQRSRSVRRVAGRTLAGAVNRTLSAGDSLPLLAELPSGAEPAWAAGTAIGTAYAALLAASARGGTLLGEDATAAVAGAVAEWDGADPPHGFALAQGLLRWLVPADRPAARLAMLAALAPGRLTDADVAAWRTKDHTDADLVRLLAFGAMTAVLRIEELITDHFAVGRPDEVPAARPVTPSVIPALSPQRVTTRR